MTGEQVLVTGVNGFIGRHMAQYLLERHMTVWGMGRSRISALCHPKFFYTPCDLGDPDAIFSWMSQHDVQYIIHLSAETAIGRADSPFDAVNVNCMGTLRLLEAVRLKPDRHVKGILLAGSALEDGVPCSVYGWSKRLSTTIGQMYAQLYGLPVVIARTFNVIGPGATAGVAPSLARQLAEMEQGLRPLRLVVGNLELARDFIDVRDVVRAYWLLLTAATFQPGEVFYVASGTARRIGDMVEVFRRHAQCPFEVTVDPALFRPGEPLAIRGDNGKLRQATGWQPQWTFEQSVLDVLNDARHRLHSSVRSSSDEKRGEMGVESDDDPRNPARVDPAQSHHPQIGPLGRPAHSRAHGAERPSEVEGHLF